MILPGFADFRGILPAGACHVRFDAESLRAEPERKSANGEAAPQGEGQQKSEHQTVLAFFWCTSRDSPGQGVSRRFVRRGALPPLCAAAQPSGSLYPPLAALASGHPGPAD